MEDWNCKTCGGTIKAMGVLGVLLYGRCENCGLDNSVDAPEDEDDEEGDYDDSMDGDHESALASAGMGVDEDYGCYGGEDW
jgi:hypothetical protein